MTVPLRVLLIEDSEDDALLVMDELRDGGYEPDHERVETREALRAALDRTAWDIIISDYRLPAFSGLDALRFVRERDADIPFIVVSGQITEETAVEAMRSGAQDYVLKDNLARLVPAIERELREVEVRRERRLAEQGLWRYRLLSERARDIILFIRTDGRIIEANDAAVNSYGYSRDELLSLTIVDLRAAEAKVPLEEQMTTADSEGILFETIHRRKDGSTFPVEVSSRGEMMGDSRVLLSIIRDITQRKRAEEALEQAFSRERHFSTLLQRALLPSMPNIGPGYDVAAEYVAAYAEREIGGDFYDVFPVGDCRAGIVIGDVAGKGLEAAAMAAATRSTIHAFVHETPSAADALTRANSVLHSQQEEFGSFVTVFLVIIDLRTGDINYANAGHLPVALCRSDGSIGFLEIGELPLAILEEQRFQEHTTGFEPGDKLVLYTDGITEARRGGTIFDIEGLERTVALNAHLPANDLARALLAAATDWADGRLTDDAAVVVVERRRLEE